MRCRAEPRGRAWFIPMIRNAGRSHMMGLPHRTGLHLTTSSVPPAVLPAGANFHIRGNIGAGGHPAGQSHGSSVPVAAGGRALCLPDRVRRGSWLTWTGDGAIRTAAFHEGIFARSPSACRLITVIQKPGSPSAPGWTSTAPGDPEDMPAPTGIEPLKCDGNNVLEVYCRAANRAGGVVLTEMARGARGRDLPHGRARHPRRNGKPATRFSPRPVRGIGDGAIRSDSSRPGSLEEGIPEATLHEVEGQAAHAVTEAADRALLSRDHLPEPQTALFEGISEGGVLHGMADRLTARERPSVLRRELRV